MYLIEMTQWKCNRANKLRYLTEPIRTGTKSLWLVFFVWSNKADVEKASNWSNYDKPKTLEEKMNSNKICYDSLSYVPLLWPLTNVFSYTIIVNVDCWYYIATKTNLLLLMQLLVMRWSGDILVEVLLKSVSPIPAEDVISDVQHVTTQ